MALPELARAILRLVVAHFYDTQAKQSPADRDEAGPMASERSNQQAARDRSLRRRHGRQRDQGHGLRFRPVRVEMRIRGLTWQDDPKTAGALAFALKLVEHRGQVADADIEALRAAGFDDGQIIEIIAHVARNQFPNYVNIALDVPVDFKGVKPPHCLERVPVKRNHLAD